MQYQHFGLKNATNFPNEPVTRKCFCFAFCSGKPQSELLLVTDSLKPGIYLASFSNRLVFILNVRSDQRELRIGREGSGLQYSRYTATRFRLEIPSDSKYGLYYGNVFLRLAGVLVKYNAGGKSCENCSLYWPDRCTQRFVRTLFVLSDDLLRY